MARSVDLGNPFLTDLTDTCEALLVRHGEQTFLPNMPIGDALNPPLSTLGEKQALAVGERLASVELAAVHASPLERALRTGQAIAGHHGIDVALQPKIEEINTWRDLPQDLGLLDSVGKDKVREILRAANRTKRWDAYPYGEPRDEFRARVIETIDHILTQHEGERIVIACHGGVINTYLSHLFHSDFDTVCSIHHTSITTIRASGERRAVIQVNDYAHVLPLQTAIDPMNVT